ncbi:MAG: FeoB-associated Cys-rich membrane protein [Ruminococcus sp.]|nr:FeoB-associated Cys-rich membrane protein [Ruminococcus sp.]
MNVADIILIVVIAGVLGFALWLNRRRKKNGSCCGGSSCTCCTGCKTSEKK